MSGGTAHGLGPFDPYWTDDVKPPRRGAGWRAPSRLRLWRRRWRWSASRSLAPLRPPAEDSGASVVAASPPSEVVDLSAAPALALEGVERGPDQPRNPSRSRRPRPQRRAWRRPARRRRPGAAGRGMARRRATGGGQPVRRGGGDGGRRRRGGRTARRDGNACQRLGADRMGGADARGRRRPRLRGVPARAARRRAQGRRLRRVRRDGRRGGARLRDRAIEPDQGGARGRFRRGAEAGTGAPRGLPHAARLSA